MLLVKDFPYLQEIKTPLPRLLAESFLHDGLLEDKGADSNPSIVRWATELGQGVGKVYLNDGIAWCGLYRGILSKRTNYPVVRDPLWALNWAHFGVRVKVPMLGDTLVFRRPGGFGHVTLYAGESKDSYLCHGGNQSDAVCFAWMPKSRLYAACRPVFAIGQPASVKRMYVNRNGELSENEG